MPRLGNISIQYTGQSMSGLVRELNRRLDTMKQAFNTNFLRSFPQVDAVITQNADVSLFIPLYDCEIDTWSVYCSNVTPNPTVNLRLNGVNQDTQTQTAIQVYEYALDPVIPVSRLDRISLNVAAMAAGGIMTAAIGLRRLN